MSSLPPSNESGGTPPISDSTDPIPYPPSKEPFLAIPADEPGSDPIATGPALSTHHLRTVRVNWWLPALLLVATCISTFFAGAMAWEPLIVMNLFYTDSPETLGMVIRQTILRHAHQGGVYMLCVIGILFAHEMGHYIATRIYRIPSTLPFFIPFPIAPFGTMGAVIAMKGQQANRREIFDIGIAGPLAGLLIAIPVVWYGVVQLDASAPGYGSYRYDLPLLIRWMYSWLHPNSPGITEVYASQGNALFMAGWAGLLITGLNMMPLSQLDGGHVTYTLFGKHSRWIARAFVALAIAYMAYTRVLIWALMLVLVFVIGIYHPPTADDRVPLGKLRVILGLLSLVIPVLCFPPRGLMPY